MSEALVLSKMKEEIDAMIALFGEENAPPPWATFTIANDIKEGNMHVVQKVFEGPFEVSWCFVVFLDLLTNGTVRHHIFFGIRPCASHV